MRKIKRMGNIRTGSITGMGNLPGHTALEQQESFIILQDDMPHEVALIDDLPKNFDKEFLSGDDALMEAKAHHASVKSEKATNNGQVNGH